MVVFHRVALHPLFQIELEFKTVGFYEGGGGGGSEEPVEKTSEQGQQPARNSTDICCRVQESSPGYIGGR